MTTRIEGRRDDADTSRPPPAMTTGLLAWLRTNLFHTPWDALATVIVGVLLAALLSSFIGWVVREANWFAVTRNMRLFMVGTLQGDPGAVVRVQVAAIAVSVLIGFSVAAWWRVSRGFALAILILLALLAGLPQFADQILPPSATYLVAGETPVVSGTQTSFAAPEVAFLGRAGEPVTFQQAGVVGDDALSSLYGFTDRAASGLINAALNRRRDLNRIAELEALLTGTLSKEQVAEYNAEREALRAEAAEPITERYRLNTLPTAVELRYGDQVIVQGSVEQGSAALSGTLPEDGWYVVRLESAEPESLALLRLTGVYPHYDRQVTMIPEGEARARAVTQAIRMTDEYLTTAEPPTGQTGEADPLLINSHQYSGSRTFSEFLGLHLAPFFEILGRGLIPVLLAAAFGYQLALALEQVLTRRGSMTARQTTIRYSAWGWFVLPFVIFGLVANTQVNQWGGLFLTFMLAAVGIVASFPIGVLLALGRRAQQLPAIQLASVAFIEGVRGVPLITVLYLSQLALPLVSPALADVPNPVRAMVAITLFSAAYLAENVRGGLQAVPHGQVEAARALGLNAFQITVNITLPQALRAVIPALVGQFISLFKDTSLVAIVGLQELTNISLSIVAQAEYIGLRRETFLFISVIYFIFSYAMSYASRRLEATGSGAILRTREAA